MLNLNSEINIDQLEEMIKDQVDRISRHKEEIQHLKSDCTPSEYYVVLDRQVICKKEKKHLDLMMEVFDELYHKESELEVA